MLLCSIFCSSYEVNAFVDPNQNQTSPINLDDGQAVACNEATLRWIEDLKARIAELKRVLKNEERQLAEINALEMHPSDKRHILDQYLKNIRALKSQIKRLEEELARLEELCKEASADDAYTIPPYNNPGGQPQVEDPITIMRRMHKEGFQVRSLDPMTGEVQVLDPNPLNY